MEDSRNLTNTESASGRTGHPLPASPAGGVVGTVISDPGADETSFMLMNGEARTRLATFAKFLPLRIAEANEAILLDVDAGSKYKLGMVDTKNGARLGAIAHALRITTQEILAIPMPRPQFQHLKAIAYGQLPRTTGSLTNGAVTMWESFAATDVEADDQELRVAEYRATAFNRAPVNMRDYAVWLLGRAATIGASDVHLEPGFDSGRIRFRMDGILETVESNIPANRFGELVRVLAAMSPEVRSDRMRLETFSATIPLKIVDNGGQPRRTEFRVEFAPTKTGVAATIRQNAKPLTDITRIGFEPEQLEQIYRALKNPTGIILVTGPTGSGKSNTLEAALAILERGDDRKLIQIGNPIEFVFPGRVQMSISDFLSWEAAFKSSLRQDPDIISPGECRDRHEAKLVLNAALTGHLVLTSFHTNDIASTFTRLAQMEISADNQADAINLIIAQRLVRMLCAACKQEDKTKTLQGNVRPYRRVGCDKCSNTGYRGRTAIAEVLCVTPDVRELIRRQANGNVAGAQIVEYASTRLGMLTLKDVAQRRVRSGVTSISEAERVIYLEAEEPTTERETAYMPAAEPAPLNGQASLAVPADQSVRGPRGQLYATEATRAGGRAALPIKGGV